MKSDFYIITFSFMSSAKDFIYLRQHLLNLRHWIWICWLFLSLGETYRISNTSHNNLQRACNRKRGNYWFHHIFFYNFLHTVLLLTPLWSLCCHKLYTPRSIALYILELIKKIGKFATDYLTLFLKYCIFLFLSTWVFVFWILRSKLMKSIILEVLQHQWLIANSIWQGIDFDC